MRLAASRVLVGLVILAVVTLVPTTGGASPLAVWIGVCAVAFAAVLGALAAARHAVLLAATGLALVMGSLVPLDGGGGAARWAALALLPTVVPLAGLTLAPSGGASRLLVAGALLGGPVRALGDDPFRDPACRACLSLPTAVTLPVTAAAALALVGAAMTVLGLGLALRGHPLRLVVAGLAGVSLWSLTAWSDVRGTTPEAAAAASLLATWGAGLVVARTLSARSRLRQLAVALGSGIAPQASLQRALRDESLRVEFAVGPQEWVDATGRATTGPAGAQVTTDVRMGSEVVARVRHRRDWGRADALAACLTPELRLALEHARLTVRLEHQVRLLRESRTRVVEVGDATRMRLERDLHDGAQQELLALGFDLRRALTAAPQDASLAACVQEVMGALDDLRSLASGVHPAILSSAGLGPALDVARSRCPHDVRTAALPEQRFPPVVERTAYLLVVDMAVQGPVEVAGSVADGWLRLRVVGAPLPQTSVVPERVASLGGTLIATTTMTEVTLPCV